MTRAVMDWSDDGQPVRRFDIAREGVAAGLALDQREAALAGVGGNGGVRNLVVGTGTRSLQQLQTPSGRPLLVVHVLGDVHTQARGQLFLPIEVAQWWKPGSAGPSTVVGGTLSGNIFQWLGEAYFSAEEANYLWYRGPRAIRFNNQKLHQ